MIKHEAVINYIIAQGVSKLTAIRLNNPNAAGLIVASSVEHAEQIFRLLTDVFQQSATIVTYKENSPSDKINHFRFNDTQWIVSVGMVSEGTDIPRLQVCCHLSRVKTELYFRQVLGRILRVNDSANQEAWLFILAEEMLSIFANRIDQELPDVCVLMRGNAVTCDFSMTGKNKKIELTSSNALPTPTIKLLSEFSSPENLNKAHRPKNTLHEQYYLQTFGGFREKLIETFITV